MRTPDCTGHLMMVENTIIWKRLFALNQKPKLSVILPPSPALSLPLHCKLCSVSINTTKIFNNIGGLKVS